MKEILKTELFSTGSYTMTIGNIVNAAVIFLATIFAIKIIVLLIRRSFTKKGRADGRQYSIIQLVKYFLWTMSIVFILQTLRININFLIASSAALLVGIGLGLQSVFKDFIAGLILLIEGTVKVDDIVEVDGLVVQVKEIALRTSKVLTREDIDLIVPNHKFIEDNVVNWSHNGSDTRFVIDVGVDYSSDVNLVEKVLIECACNHEDVLKKEGLMPNVRFKNFGDSSLDFQLFFYSDKLFRIESVKSKLRFLILEGFRKNGISIPFPQRVITYANEPKVE